ncbi:biotin/lipoyl-containing protein [Filifactor villosus]|uniref:Biotin/lipoyl-containing protein n=1 Tax=Filifactor villosus TaxID=29374 RepID=A0ABV9QLR2_9FIRM
MKYVVTINGKKYDVEVEKVNAYRPLTVEEVQSGNIQRTAPVAAPAPAAAPVPTPAPAPAPAPAAASGGANTVVSPMPGNILDVRTAVGSSVKAGQVLIILEAMKMENEIVAPSDGVVESIAVKQGDVVETDQTLVVLK